MTSQWLVYGLAACLVGLPSSQIEQKAATTQIQPLRAEDLTMEKLFRGRSYSGQQARGTSFSHQGRYLAYLWNPYGEVGADLYIYDSQNGQAKRITSLEIMKAYEAPETIERFIKKAADRDKQIELAQEKVDAQAAYLLGKNIDLDKWDMAAIEELKKEEAIKKAKAEEEKQKAEAEKKQDEGEGAPEATNARRGQGAGGRQAQQEKEKELWEWRDELKKKQEKDNVRPNDLYPGISGISWANKNDELIFTYRGDLFRYTVGNGKIERLTNTDKTERMIGYTPNDDGYLFQDGSNIFKVDFNSGRQVQINRALVFADDAEKRYSIQNTTLSEDGKWMAIGAVLQETPATGSTTGGRGGGQQQQQQQGQGQVRGGRQVQIMHYTGRFAEARSVQREVSDDRLRTQSTAIFIRKVDENPTRTPAPVITFEGGDVWFERTPVAFTKDGSKYTFATWEREKELLRVYMGDSNNAEEPEVVIERKGDVGHEVVTSLAPRFTPDGKTLVVVLDDVTGFRQPWAMDVTTKSIKPVVSGNFEAHTILGFTPDSKYMFLLANKNEPAAMHVFQVEMTSGSMKLIGNKDDFHRSSTVAENGTMVAMNSGNWLKRNELHVINVATQDSKVLTESYDPEWNRIHILPPTRFTFQNRHGDNIEGYVFKPKGWKKTDKRPSIVYIYGGPLGDRHSVELDSFQGTGYMFGMYMAAKHGYVTVTIDPRGQSNYGRRFAGANWENAGQPQTEDLEDLMKEMKKDFGVDTNRVGLTGWSFGGFQTQYTMYSKPDLFACGIAGAGPTEWENYNSWYSGRTIGQVDRSKPVLRKYSLLPMAKNLRKPLLLVHGMVDPNVLYQDTVNVYRALLESGKESIVDLFLDPDGEHGMGGAVKTRGQHKKYEAFFLQHLGKGK
ncbi:MAG: prolyl oligopeptidase family serine peptidase [Holophagaceae bacterium]|nr:prolyl oligopeptidase family serine peptidase [Holophagaceae bacterium]